MVSYANLEQQLARLNEKIKQLQLINDYEGLIKAIRQAELLCKRIYEESPDPHKKDIMRKNMTNLKQLFREVSEKVNPELVIGEKKPTKPVKKPSGSNKKDTKGKNDDGDISYEFNGIDVKQFLTDESNDVVMFDDVIGMEDEKKLIKREFFLTDRQREFKKARGMKPKTFILLYGVPGTGKTFFAKAISCELKAFQEEGKEIPFFSVVGTQLKDAKVGATEKNIQALFEFCKQFDHCVLFIDEFDSLVPDRGKANGDPTAQTTVTTFLQMMDGFSSAQGTLLISATNCPYNIDGAVLSRANAEIEIPLPSKAVILATLNRKVKDAIASDINLDAIADRLIGYSNRDIKKYIANLNDQVFDALSADEAKGIFKDFSEYKFTNDMFEKAFVAIPSSVKASDKRLIVEYQKSRGQ